MEPQSRFNLDKIQLTHFLNKIKVDDLTGCWNWKGCDIRGYGQFTINGKGIGVHRVTYEHWNGKIPDGYHVDHLCRNVGCCNPMHLEAVTPKENGVRRSTKYCPQGHYKNESNIYIKPDGYKVCLTCKKDNLKRFRSGKSKSYSLRHYSISTLQRWAKVVKKRDKVCQHCNTTNNLNSHHILSISEYPEFSLIPANGMVLCQPCHVDIHRWID